MNLRNQKGGAPAGNRDVPEQKSTVNGRKLPKIIKGLLLVTTRADGFSEMCFKPEY